MKEIYKVVLAAQEAAIKFLRPGVTTQQADRVARDIIDRLDLKIILGMDWGTASGGRFTSCRPCAKRVGTKSFGRV